MPSASRPACPAPWHYLPLALIAAVYLLASTGPALRDQNESQYAGAVREMLDRPQDYAAAAHGQLERGHWWLPTNDGVPRLQKPPLVYWLLMASMRAFGVTDFAARLPNALFTLGWFAAAFLLARRVAGEAFALASTTILATMAGTFIFSHLVAPEPFLACFLALTFWCFLGALQEPARAWRWLFGAWMCMGLGTMSKGLHGALYPLAAAGWLAWRRPATRPVWRKLAHPAGWLAFLGMVLPWYAAVGARFPGFLYDQFINEQLGHAVNRRYPRDAHTVPLWLFAAEHLIFFLPWTFFLPAACLCVGTPQKTSVILSEPGRVEGPSNATGRRTLEGLPSAVSRTRLSTRKLAQDDRQKGGAHQNVAGGAPALQIGGELLAAWFGVTAATLVFSSLQDYYLLTAFVPVACWLARAWPDGAEPPRWTRLLPGFALATLGLLACAAGVYLTLHVAATGAISTTPTALRDSIAATLAGFSPSAWKKLLPLAWLAGGALLAGGVGGLALARLGRWRAMLPVTALAMAAVLLAAWRGMVLLEDEFSLKRVALAANARADPGACVVCDGELIDNPSLLFYLDREVCWVHAHPSVEFASRELKIGVRLYLDEEEFARRWASGRTVFLVAEADAVPHWRGMLGLTPEQATPVARSGTRVLLVNYLSKL